MTGDSGDRLVVGIAQIVTASILVHADGRSRFIQYDPVRGMYSITDDVIDQGLPAYEVNQQEVLIHLPNPPRS